MSLSRSIPGSKPVRDTLLTLAALVVVLAGARYASNLLVPFLLALFMATILSSPITRLRQRGVANWLAVSIVASAALLFIALVFVLLGSTISGFVQILPDYEEQLRNLLRGWLDWLDNRGIEISGDALSSALDPGSAMGFFAGFLSGLGDTLSNLLLIILTVVFMLADASSLGDKLAAGRTPENSQRIAGLSVLAVSMNRYVTTKTLLSLLTGLLISTGMWLLDVQFALLWGFLAFLLNFIPNIGSFIAAVPAVLLSLLERDPLLTGLMLLLYLLVNTLVGNVIEPRVMGQRLGLSTLAVFLSLIFWGWMFGPVGMLLSVPLTMVIKFVAEQQPGSAWFAVLISKPEPLPAPDSEGDSSG
ncbi:AI-2E family transporter [Seongchinamella sediminis]|uniref:AI-2E family transporter n=1 Tax=Seongchinamella sediminis TaxID=2283635 RepID=A0A3L7DXG8_9GAMM|nr:AI-2E family transporter [Seongchinamella sediminis]RLQ20671.1 AI-2E family transporter [Seongchinamella sediminis]